MGAGRGPGQLIAIPSALKLYIGDIFGGRLSYAVSLRCIMGEKGLWKLPFRFCFPGKTFW